MPNRSCLKAPGASPCELSTPWSVHVPVLEWDVWMTTVIRYVMYPKTAFYQDDDFPHVATLLQKKPSKISKMTNTLWMILSQIEIGLSAWSSVTNSFRWWLVRIPAKTNHLSSTFYIMKPLIEKRIGRYHPFYNWLYSSRLIAAIIIAAARYYPTTAQHHDGISGFHDFTCTADLERSALGCGNRKWFGAQWGPYKWSYMPYKWPYKRVSLFFLFSSK